VGSLIEHHYKDYEDWPCIKCGQMIRLLKPLHQMPPEVKCAKCKGKKRIKNRKRGLKNG